MNIRNYRQSSNKTYDLNEKHNIGNGVIVTNVNLNYTITCKHKTCPNKIDISFNDLYLTDIPKIEQQLDKYLYEIHKFEKIENSYYCEYCASIHKKLVK